ncbi:hypothetical protein [Salinispora sp. H7-4]|uniref:hypothetical protein n=1 Tax=Salinispora sp. H7-4 TaxID=2748321 RepID=UPI0015D3AF73|nr:hypothetical protein [Salinispora sp. H7-4]NYT95674.1 hypothetical protein [Salinispora sp. H7-4]
MSSSLTEIVLPQRPPGMPCLTTVTDGDRLSLFVALEAVDDLRDPRGRRYPLVSEASQVGRLDVPVGYFLVEQAHAAALEGRVVIGVLRERPCGGGGSFLTSLRRGHPKHA